MEKVPYVRTNSGIAVPAKFFASSADRATDLAGINIATGRLFIQPKKTRIPTNMQSKMIMIWGHVTCQQKARARVLVTYFDSREVLNKLPHSRRHPTREPRWLSSGISGCCTSIWDEGFVLQITQLKIIRGWWLVMIHLIFGGCGTEGSKGKQLNKTNS